MPFGVGGTFATRAKAKAVVVSSVSPSVGDTLAGTPVTIVGSGFGGTASVTIGGTPCTGVTVVSSALIECIAPAKSAGTYDVAVTVEGVTRTIVGAYQAWSPELIANMILGDPASGVTASGGTISSWATRGVSRTVSQASAAAKPTVVASRFGRRSASPGVSFDGGDSLALASLEPTPAGYTKFCVVKYLRSEDGVPDFPNNNPASVVIGNSHSSAYAEGPGLTDAGAASVYNFDSVSASPAHLEGGSGLNDGNPHRIIFTHATSGAWALYVDGVLVNSGAHEYVTTFSKWDTIGAGFSTADRLSGELGAWGVAPGVANGTEIGLLDAWLSAKYTRGALTHTRIVASTTYLRRDGAALWLVNGRLIMGGGWDPVGNPEWALTTTTNEVWISDDGGLTQTKVRAHEDNPAQSGPSALFRPRHVFPDPVHKASDGLDYAYALGGDQTDPNFPSYPRDVWRSRDGQTWIPVTLNAAWPGRALHMGASLNRVLYVFGGQSDFADPATVMRDVWKSDDDGATWTRLPDAPWLPRGAAGVAVWRGLIWMVGGGSFHYDPAQRTFYGDIWTFDGATWRQVIADGAAPFERREYLKLVAMNDRLVFANGFGANGNISDMWWSLDGSNWVRHTMTPWPQRHADSRTTDGTKIWQLGGVFGDDSDRMIWTIQ